MKTCPHPENTPHSPFFLSPFWRAFRTRANHLSSRRSDSSSPCTSLICQSRPLLDLAPCMQGIRPVASASPSRFQSARSCFADRISCRPRNCSLPLPCRGLAVKYCSHMSSSRSSSRFLRSRVTLLLLQPSAVPSFYLTSYPVSCSTVSAFSGKVLIEFGTDSSWK